MLDLSQAKTIYGGSLQIDENTLRLLASKGTKDGIGCALVFIPWHGEPLSFSVSRLEVWGDAEAEPWRDVWFTPRQHAQADPHPMRYLRFTSAVCGMGEIRGGDPGDQVIHETTRRWGVPFGPRQVNYRVSWGAGALHVEAADWPETRSLPAPMPELPLYCEACVVDVAFY